MIFLRTHKWLLAFTAVYGVFIGLPFLAPVLMKLGWELPAAAIYRAYSFLCHQLPERSYFLFGPDISYSLGEIQRAYVDTLDPAVLRQFIGAPDMGWKVAWSDRMVSMYSSPLPAAWIFSAVGSRLRPLSLKGAIMFAVPMAVDGFSHMLSDFAGIEQGFRQSNQWLVNLTGGLFSPNFYAGNAWGSFNAWMRLITGVLFGIGLVWYLLSFLQQESVLES